MKREDKSVRQGVISVKKRNNSPVTNIPNQHGIIIRAQGLILALHIDQSLKAGASLRIFEWGTNRRRRVANLTPKYPKIRKYTGFGPLRSRIWRGRTLLTFHCGGRRPPVPRFRRAWLKAIRVPNRHNLFLLPMKK